MEDTQELPVKINLDDKYLVYLQKLEINHNRFTREMRRRVGPDDQAIRVLENGKAKFLVQGKDGAPDRVVLTSEWIPLGIYEKIAPEQPGETSGEFYVWVWAWHFFPEECKSLKEESDKLPDELDVLRKPIITTQVGMLVSFLMSFVTATMELQHVYVCPTEENNYLAVGMRGIEWGEVVYPDPPKPDPKNNLNKLTTEVTTTQNESSGETQGQGVDGGERQDS
jgi:hypothetical protein